MSNNDFDAIGSSRIYDDSFTAAGAIDEDVTGWTIGDDLIIGMAVWQGVSGPACNKSYNSCQFKLQYERDDDPGNYYDVDTGNHLTPGTTSSFNDDQSDTTQRLNRSS